MGFCAKATLSYGIILQEPQIKKLLAAIWADSNDSDEDEGENTSEDKDENASEDDDENASEDDDEDSFEPGDSEWIETIDSWLDDEKCIKACEPFSFQIQGNPLRTGETRGDCDVNLAFIFYNQRGQSFDEDPSVEIWGSEGGSRIQGISPSDSLLCNEKFMNAAKEGFRKLKNTKAFRKAGITVTVPQWILRLSTG